MAVKWLAAARTPLEKLTMAALNAEVSDAEFVAMVEAFSKSLPKLLEKMDHGPCQKLMEESMGAAMANGVAARMETLPVKKAKLPWETAAWWAGRKFKRDKNGQFSNTDGGLNFREAKWEGNPKEMQQRAADRMRLLPIMQHPSTGVEMKITTDGIRKSLYAMRAPEEFMVASRIKEIYLHSTKKGDGEPDRKMRYGIKAFHRFEATVTIGRQRSTVEIITKELEGNPIHHLKQIRIK